MAASVGVSQLFASRAFGSSGNVHLHLRQTARLCHIPVKQTESCHISPTKACCFRTQPSKWLPKSVRQGALLFGDARPTLTDSLSAHRPYSVLPQRAIFTTPVWMAADEVEDRACWNCGRTTKISREPFFCDCGVVQSPAGDASYFKLMGMEPSFQIDLKKLNAIFIDLQKRLHPDKFSTKSEEEKKLAEEQSALLNKAYHTLQKPLPRALYLLELNGYTLEEGETEMNPEFLMEILDLNERIGECNTEDIAEIENEIAAKIEENTKLLSQAFAEKDYQKAKDTVVKLKYYVNVESKVKAFYRDRM